MLGVEPTLETEWVRDSAYVLAADGLREWLSASLVLPELCDETSSESLWNPERLGLLSLLARARTERFESSHEKADEER